MTKKKKKIFKHHSKLAPKININKKTINWRQLETKNQLLNEKNQLKKIILYSMFRDDFNYLNNDKNLIRLRLNFLIQKFTKNACISTLKNRCFYIGRSRGMNAKLFMSRHVFRKFARFGMLPGFMKERKC
jgi:ribosomal protein S14